MNELTVHNLGHISYADALAEQMGFVEALKASHSDDVHLLLVEHDPPVITLGRRGQEEDILVSRQRLAERGIEVHDASRGGQVTYHGPGQLVAYVIAYLGRRGRDVRGHVRRLEETVIRTLAAFGLDGRRRDGQAYTGVWVGPEEAPRKIAAIGVAVSRWVSYHGLALNVRTDLSAFELIVPCGLGEPVTSLAQETGLDRTVDEVKPVLVDAFRSAYMAEERERFEK